MTTDTTPTPTPAETAEDIANRVGWLHRSGLRLCGVTDIAMAMDAYAKQQVDAKDAEIARLERINAELVEHRRVLNLEGGRLSALVRQLRTLAEIAEAQRDQERARADAAERRARKAEFEARTERRASIARAAISSSTPKAGTAPDGGPDGSVLKTWIVVHEPGRVPQKNGSFKDGAVNDFLRELIACRPEGTRYTVADLTWDHDLWVQDGHERLQMADAMDSLTDEDWAEIDAGREDDGGDDEDASGQPGDGEVG